MGLFDFFSRRRERESAIPGATPESLTRQLKGDGSTIGQPVQGAGQPQGFDPTSMSDLGSMFGMIQQAMQSGSVQVTQGQNQVIDLRGTELREQIIAALEQHGIDPNGAEGSQISAGDVPGLQAQIMQALENAGVDVSQMGDAPGGITIESGGSDSGATADSGGGDSGGGDSGGGGGE